MSVRGLRRGAIAASRGAAGTPTTYTIYSDAADAYVVSTPTAGDGDGLSANGGDIYTGMQVNAAYEGYLSFDTSAVAGTITAVTLSLYGMNDSSTTDFTLEARVYDWGASATVDEWRGASTLGSLTLVASISTASWVTSAYNVLTSDPAFPANINKGGTSYFIMSSSRHRTGATPSGAEFVGYRSRDTGDTTTGPKLVIDSLV